MAKPIKVIYTGGTIGSKPKDPDPDSPQKVVGWDEFAESVPNMDNLGFSIDPVVLTPPLDSCNVGPAEWRFMVDAIAKDHDKYAGFVVLHGTDTMVYTGSALSQLLFNLHKPVVLTGAQRSAMVDPIRNDANQNFLTACQLANPEAMGIPAIPEVVIYFGGSILRANRAEKVHTSGYDAYVTPNLPPLGTVGDSIEIDSSLVLPMPKGEFSPRRTLDPNVLPILIYPGIQDTDQLARQLADPALKAAVILSYGSGNIPTHEEFLDVLREARSRGMVLANVSQCSSGPVELGIYETSALLLEAGFVSGIDMTLEAAQTKLMTLFGEIAADDYEPDEARDIVERAFEIDRAGEMGTSIYVTDLGEKSAGEADAGASVPARQRVRAGSIEGQFEASDVQRVLIRLRGAKLESPDPEDFAEIRVFLDVTEEDELKNSDPRFAGTFRKSPADVKGLIVMNITRAFQSVSGAGARLSPTLVMDTAGCKLSWERAEIAVFARPRR
ncbi:MAG: asparaginase [Actinomycetota bacterium]